MSEQNSGPNRAPNSGGSQNNNQSNNRRHHHHRNRRPNANGQAPGQNAVGQPNQQRPAQGGGPRNQQGTEAGAPQGNRPPQARPQGSAGGNNNRRRHRGGQNRNRSQGAGANPSGQQHPHGFSLERIYEKYLNLLDQHLIARRKYHDMFYRAEPAQKAKLERNFYNTLNDVRDFENKLAPEARDMFEKRNNGLRPDTIYTSNHQINEDEPAEGEKIIEAEGEDPHYLQSQRAANYSGDTEESVGTVDDYLRYKNLA